MGQEAPVKFRDRVKFVKLSEIKEGSRFREDYGDLSSMVESIREKGVIQPITLSTSMQLLAGGRRFRSATQAGLTEIPALIREITGELDLREIELIENIERLDPSWSERAKLVARIDTLYKEKNTDWSARKTAGMMEKGVATVSRDLKLARALERIPELAEMKDAAEALKVVAKLEEGEVIRELRLRQQSSALDKGVKAMLMLADKSYRIYDAFKGLAELPSEGKIDLIECDPPYGIDLTEVRRGKESAVSTIRGYAEIGADKYSAFLGTLCKELYRVAAPNCWLVFWYGPSWHSQVFAALNTAHWQVDDIPCIWVKPSGQTNSPEYYLARCYEPFFMARKGKPILVKRGRSNVFQFSPEGGTIKYHPTQRPMALMEEIISTFGVDLQTVLVPFLGSGVTLRAAYKLGMRAFGWDYNTDLQVVKEYKDRFMLAIEQDAQEIGK
jgi:ParB/RepB/Spo0J family partition protein